MQIDLLSATSYAAGQPHEQFDWLREHDPVHWHEEPGGPGFWVAFPCAASRRLSISWLPWANGRRLAMLPSRAHSASFRQDTICISSRSSRAHR